MKTVIEMALEAGIDAEKDTLCRNEGWIEPLTRFAELVRADEREKYKWDVHSCGPACKRYACVAMREAVEAENEACAKLCEEIGEESDSFTRDILRSTAEVLRARRKK